MPVSTVVEKASKRVDGNRTGYRMLATDNGPHAYPVTFERYSATETAGRKWNEEGWKPLGEILAYKNGLPTRYRKEGWNEEVYTWTPGSLIKSRSYTANTPDERGESKSVTATTTYQYDKGDRSKLLTQVIAPDGQKTFLPL